jgi:hypothetical protein
MKKIRRVIIVFLIGLGIISAWSQFSAEEITKSVNVIYFFAKSGTENPSGKPNWYYYWSQTGASSGTHLYDSVTPYFGYYQWGANSFYIGSPASGYNPETAHDGIDCFAETCMSNVMQY